ncbi:MAG: PQQ-binding-like beta-propeller repeat protein [Deltaproteobacteria bacterium]|nr:PQQ-binding-like beta-propeller repeat protein [Nannocystaceae bacterium]
MFLLGCEGASAGSADDEGTSSGSSGTDVEASTAPSPTTTNTTTTPSEGSSEDSSSSDASTGITDTTGDPVDACDEPVEVPDVQNGTPTKLRTWPEAHIADLAIDGEHRRILSGRRAGPITFGTQTYEQHVTDKLDEVFVASVDAAGEGLWLAPIHCTGVCTVREVTAAADGNLVVVGWFDADLGIAGTVHRPATSSARQGFVAKLDATTGAVLWVLSMTPESSDPYGEAKQVVATEDGGALVVFDHEAGTWQVEGESLGEPAGFDSAGGVAFLRLDADGALEWLTLAQETPTTLFGVRSAGATRLADGFAAGLYAEGGIDIDGSVYENPMVPSTGHIVRLAEDGALVRDDMFAFGEFTDVGTAPCDDVIVLGDSQGGFEELERGPFAARVSAQGELRWSAQLATGQFTPAEELAVDPAGQAVAVHGLYGMDDTFGVTKLDADGQVLWQHVVEVGYFGHALVAADGLLGAAVFAGYLGTLSVPGIPATNGNGVFLLDLAP